MATTSRIFIKSEYGEKLARELGCVRLGPARKEFYICCPECDGSGPYAVARGTLWYAPIGLSKAQLCQKGLVFSSGTKVYTGPTGGTVFVYRVRGENG